MFTRTASEHTKPRHIGIAGLQMATAVGEDNIGRIATRIAHTKHRYPWVDVILLPELCAFGPAPLYAQPMPGDAEMRFQEIARLNKVWIVAGSLFERVGELIYNTAPIIDPHGVVVARYRKMFPFMPYEHDVASGAQFVTFDIGGVATAGVSICYDMWFGETTRTLAAMGAEIILHPTMTDTVDREIELSIARASAATNQCYFFDINSVGEFGNGQSIVVDPSGYVLHQAGVGEEVIPIRVDLERVRDERRNGMRGLGQPLKSFRDRKVIFDVYDQNNGHSPYLDTLGPLVKPASALRDLEKKIEKQQAAGGEFNGRDGEGGGQAP